MNTAVRNIDVAITPSSKVNAIQTSNMFNGKFILNANIVSKNASLNACFLSALLIVFKITLHSVFTTFYTKFV